MHRSTLFTLALLFYLFQLTNPLNSNIMSSPKPLITLLTGVTGQIGTAIGVGAASIPGNTLILAVRDLQKGQKIREQIVSKTKNDQVFLEQVDLSSKESIKQFTSHLSTKYSHLNVLINNAAIVSDTRQVSRDGIELQFAVNVYAYWLLMTQLHDMLKKGAPARIVNVASNYAGSLDVNDLQFTKRRYDANTAYTQAKQANRMLSWHAAELYKNDGITVNACHPGVVTSTVLQSLGMASGYDSPEKGAATPLFLAFDPSVASTTSAYYHNKAAKSCEFAKHPDIKKLWEYCSKL